MIHRFHMVYNVFLDAYTLKSLMKSRKVSWSLIKSQNVCEVSESLKKCREVSWSFDSLLKVRKSFEIFESLLKFIEVWWNLWKSFGVSRSFFKSFEIVQNPKKSSKVFSQSPENLKSLLLKSLEIFWSLLKSWSPLFLPSWWHNVWIQTKSIDGMNFSHHEINILSLKHDCWRISYILILINYKEIKIEHFYPK
jgi:hypothetical protein